MKKGLNRRLLVLFVLGLGESKGDGDTTLTTAIVKDATSPKPTAIYRRINVPPGPYNNHSPVNFFRSIYREQKQSTPHLDWSNWQVIWKDFQNQWKEKWKDNHNQWDDNGKNNQKQSQGTDSLRMADKNETNLKVLTNQWKDMWKEIKDQLKDNLNITSLSFKGNATDKVKEFQKGLKELPDHLKYKLNISTSRFQLNDKDDPWKRLPDQLKDYWKEMFNNNVSVYHVNKWQKQNEKEIWDWDIWCHLQPKTGSGSKSIRRFYYKSETDSCESFNYAGSGGNQNNFDSKTDCEQNCKGAVDISDRMTQDKSCSFQPNPGWCMGMFHKHYYDINESRCKNFVYGGCGGNLNRFSTLYDCMRVCHGDHKVVVERY